MTYLTDDVREVRKIAPNLDDAEAREILRRVDFDLLAGLKAAQAEGNAKKTDERKHQAREVKRLQQVAGVSRAEAERVLSANGWSLSDALASLAEAREAETAGAEDEDHDEEEPLIRGPSTNTLRNRRLERLAGGGRAAATLQVASTTRVDDQFIIAFPTSPEVKGDAEMEPEPELEPEPQGERDAEDGSVELQRLPSTNTLRNIRLQRLEGGSA